MDVDGLMAMMVGSKWDSLTNLRNDWQYMIPKYQLEYEFLKPTAGKIAMGLHIGTKGLF